MVSTEPGVQSYCMANALAITTHVERWTTEVYNFPIPVSLMKRIARGLNLSNMSGLGMVNDKDQFINLLQSQSNSVRISSIFKQRNQHLLCMDEDLKKKGNKELGELVTVEISHLTRPEDVFTLSVEHTTIDNEIAAISKIVRDIDKRAYQELVFMNNLQAVKEWSLNKKIFG